jgi:predicted dehydrogenase
VAVTIGLAGAGHRATQVHAPSIASCKHARFGGVWAPRPQAAGRLAGSYGVRAYQRFHDMFDECDAVVFAVPPAAQPDPAGVAAQRSKAVLLETPIAGDLAGAEQLAATVAALAWFPRWR